VGQQVPHKLVILQPQPADLAVVADLVVKAVAESRVLAVLTQVLQVALVVLVQYRVS
jgi:hypothetical protein